MDIPGEVAGEYNGTSVSMSADGTRFAAGGYTYSSEGVSQRGIVRVYQWNNSLSSWSRLGQDFLGGMATEYNGRSVSMSADGTRFATGGYNYSSEGLYGRGIVYPYFIPTNNMITYTSSNSSIADICGNLLLIKGTTGLSGTSNIIATQGTQVMNGTLTISDTSVTAGAQYTTYTLLYTSQNTYVLAFIMRVS